MSTAETEVRNRPAGPAREQLPTAPSLARRGARVVWVMMGVYSAVYVTVCVVKYVYFLYTDFDLAICAQATWGITRGQFFNSIRGMYWLGDHSWLTLFLIAPVYAVFRHPVTLLVIQTVVLALGALPVYWLARRELKDEFLAVCFAALYLLYPALGYSNLYEFHPVTLTTTTLLFAFYYLWVGRFGPTVLFAVLSLMGKENVPLVVGMMGLYSLLIRRPRRWVYTATLLGLAALFLLLSFAVLKPALNRGESSYETTYAHWGKTLPEAAVQMAKHPLAVVVAFFHTGDDAFDARLKREYHLHVFAPVMLLALASPLTLAIALPAVAQHLLSSRGAEHTIVFHYMALVTPFVLAASVLGLRNVLRLLVRGTPGGLTAETMRTRTPARTLGRVLGAMAVVVSLVSNVIFGPLFGLRLFQGWPADEAMWPTARDRVLAPYMTEMVNQMPREGTLACGLRFLARFTNRDDVHAFHHIAKGTYTVSSKRYPVPDDVVAVIVDTGRYSYHRHWRVDRGARIREFLARNRLRPVEAAEMTVLLMRVPGEHGELLEDGAVTPERFYRAGFRGLVEFVGWDRPPPKVNVGGKLPVRTVWKRLGPTDFPPDLLYVTQFVLVDGRLREVHQATRYLGYGVYPVNDWPVGGTVRETFNLVIPLDVRPGTYRLYMRLLEEEDGESGQRVGRVAQSTDPRLRRAGGVIELGTVEVTLPER